eukprot:IDg10381t1
MRSDRRGTEFENNLNKVTLMACISASGESVQPLWIFKGKNVPFHMAKAVDGSTVQRIAYLTGSSEKVERQRLASERVMLHWRVNRYKLDVSRMKVQRTIKEHRTMARVREERKKLDADFGEVGDALDC